MSQKPADESKGADGADSQTNAADAGPVQQMKKRRIPCS